MFDVLIIGGGVSGISCALVLGSAKNKPFATDKKSEFLRIKNHLIFKKLCSITLTEFPREL